MRPIWGQTLSVRKLQLAVFTVRWTVLERHKDNLLSLADLSSVSSCSSASKAL